jgi:hypothetical protein
MDVLATNAIQLNTLVETISVESTVSGDIFINEATGLTVDLAVAQDGKIEIIAGGDLSIRDVRNVASGDDIIIKSAKDLYVDYVEAATSMGAQKTSGSVTVDARGTLYELPAIERDDEGHIISSAYDQTSADLYGYTVTINGNTASPPLVLSDPTVAGTGNEIEVRYIAETGGLTTGPTTVNQV